MSDSQPTMRAAVIPRPGQEGLHVEMVARPEPERDELLVRIHAAALNPADAILRKGPAKLLAALRYPLIPGADLAGEVVAAGGEVKSFRPGDRVFGMLSALRGGAYAEFVAITQDAIAAMPESLSWTEAAAVPVGGVTALQALRDKACVQPGMRVLINGASGGVGTFAVQIARAMGAEVTGVCGSDAAGLVRELGASRVIDYEREDFAAGDEVYEIIFDVAANRSYHECKDVLAPAGTYVSTRPGPGMVAAKALTIFAEQKAEFVAVSPNADDLRELKRMIEAGQVRPIVDRVFPLEQAEPAQQHLQHGHPRGKVVLRIDSGAPAS